MSEVLKYTCENCQRELKSDWSNEEAEAEAKENFPGVPDEDMVIVCDDCFEEMGLRWPGQT